MVYVDSRSIKFPCCQPVTGGVPQTGILQPCSTVAAAYLSRVSLSLSLARSTMLCRHGICPTACWTTASSGHASANARVNEVRREKPPTDSAVERQ